MGRLAIVASRRGSGVLAAVRAAEPGALGIKGERCASTARGTGPQVVPGRPQHRFRVTVPGQDPEVIPEDLVLVELEHLGWPCHRRPSFAGGLTPNRTVLTAHSNSLAERVPRS